MQSKGWVKLWREQFTHEVSERKPWCDGYAWSYLYSQANYKPGIANFRNQYIPVERGQFITSLLKLSQTFGWTWRRTRSFLNNLQNDEMLILKFSPKSHNEQHNKQHNRFLTITICNYEKYQGTDEEDDTTDRTTDRRTAAQQSHTIKEVKEVKNIGRSKESDPRVKEFLNYWGESFKRETGQPYPFSYEKDGQLTKDLLKLYSPETLQEITKAFFRDEWCKGKGFDFGLFRKQVGRFISLKGTNPLEQARRELKEFAEGD